MTWVTQRVERERKRRGNPDGHYSSMIRPSTFELGRLSRLDKGNLPLYIFTMWSTYPLVSLCIGFFALRSLTVWPQGLADIFLHCSELKQSVPRHKRILVDMQTRAKGPEFECHVSS